jgi:hypothetical protein
MRSMLAKRNAIGQLVKASTRLGDREVGTGKLTAASLRTGCAPVELSRHPARIALREVLRSP